MQKQTAKSIDRSAADWVARMDSGELTPDQETALQCWLDSDSRCLGALARAQALFVSPQMVQAIRNAPRHPSPAALLGRRGFFAAAAGGVIAAALIFERRDDGKSQLHASQLGEIKQIRLEDGSHIALNTDSAVRVEYQKDFRRVTLLRGEAFFEVAKDPRRPFIVVGPSAQARAVGTAYGVRLDEDGGRMRIRVATGRVAVESPPSMLAVQFRALKSLLPQIGPDSSNGAYLNANQEADVRIAGDGPDKGEVQISVRDLSPEIFERSLMWREGLLSFEGTTLSEAIAEFSRYSRQKIVLRGPLARERISGLFAANDPAGFSRAIALSLKVKVKTESDTIVLYK